MTRFCIALLLLVASLQLPAQPAGYYRQPALHGDTLVFTAEGDLWKVSVAGGIAQRLTTHPDSESRAVISPNGGQVAFTAQYEGPQDIYLMPLAGGLPRRLTFEGGAGAVGWTPAGEILFTTAQLSTLPNDQLVSLNPTNSTRRVVPLAQASEGCYDDAGRTLFFTRLAFQGSATKRYQGGTAQNLWRFTEGEPEAVALTPDFPGTSKHPMWWQGRVYFVSDRDGIMNLWSMQPDGADLRQHTRQREFDVKSPSLHAGRIAYQLGADLRLLELASGQDRLIPITLATDADHQRERWVKRPLEFLTSAHVSPDGDRLVLTARGQVFVAPVKAGRLVEVPRQQGVRYRNARFLDAKSLVALSDETGELEFVQLPANGLGTNTPLTSEGKIFASAPRPRLTASVSPGRTRTRNSGCRRSRTSAPRWSSPRPPARCQTWPGRRMANGSPTCSRRPTRFRQVWLWRVSDGRRVAVTSDRTESFSPAWSPDGKWLYFISDRQVRTLVGSPWGLRQPDPFYTEGCKLYGVALSPGQRWPFQPRDELQVADKPAAKPATTNAPPKTVVKLDPVGLPERLFEVPLPAGNYSQLEVTAKQLLYSARGTGFEAKRNLQQLEISAENPKPKTLVDDIADYELTGDGKKLLIRKGEAFHVIAADVAAPAKLDDNRVDLAGWTFSLDPREEWRQIYTESWRMLRDYFYDRDLHGVDWAAVRQKYLPLVDRVADRAELNDVLSEMAGELGALHTFVRFGDLRQGPDQVQPGFLGARLAPDAAGKGWRVEHIFKSDPEYPGARAPLDRASGEVKAGSVITSINGRPTAAAASPYELLRNQAGKQALLEVRTSPEAPVRPVIVTPIAAGEEAGLRYHEWELTRRERVEELGASQIGYVHLRAMGAEDMAAWAREFYPVFQRQGLIIDVRHNRGGNIDSWILAKLLRQAWFYWQPPVGNPYWNMQYAFRGHVVVLCNERTASDGEAFAEGFRRLGLGKVIGTRTWGGEIWLSAQRWLVDNGMASAAELGVYGPEGEWLIEGHGVEPDVVVDNLPHATYQGRDAQIEAAVKHLQEAIAKDPRPVPPAPKHPDKSFRPR